MKGQPTSDVHCVLDHALRMLRSLTSAGRPLSPGDRLPAAIAALLLRKARRRRRCSALLSPPARRRR
jgi:hypothetical protein